MKTTEEAQEYLQQFYPESNGWSITQHGKGMVIKGEFWVPVGRNTKYGDFFYEDLFRSYKDYYDEYIQPEEFYFFTVSNDTTYETGFAKVNHAGRILVTGAHLNGIPDDNQDYRIQ